MVIATLYLPVYPGNGSMIKVKSHCHGLVIRILFRLELKIFLHTKLILSSILYHYLCRLSLNQGRKLNWYGKTGYSKSHVCLLLYILQYSGKLLIDCMRDCSHQTLLLSYLTYNNQVISLKTVDMTGSFLHLHDGSNMKVVQIWQFLKGVWKPDIRALRWEYTQVLVILPWSSLSLHTSWMEVY